MTWNPSLQLKSSLTLKNHFAKLYNLWQAGVTSVFCVAQKWTTQNSVQSQCKTIVMVSISSDGSGGDDGQVLALREMLGDFEMKQRGLLLLAIDKAVDKTMKKQSEMLEAIRTKVEARHCVAVSELRDEMLRTQPSIIATLISRTLDAQKNTGLVSWINDDGKKHLVLAYLAKLRNHLESGPGNAFRSDFEALLVLYMEYLKIPMIRGSRLNNRIEDLHQGLLDKADSNDDLVNLVHRVRWACFGVRAIGNARSHDATLLSESEILELCGCFSAIGAGMPTLAREFQVCKQPSVDASPLSETNLPVNSNTGMDLAMLAQLRQAAGGNSDQTPFDFLFQLMTDNGFNVNVTTSPPRLQDTQANQPSLLSPGFNNDGFSLSGQAQPLQSGSPDMNDLDLTSLNLNGLSLNGSTLNGLTLNGSTLNSSTLNRLNLTSFDKRDSTTTQAPSLLRLGSISSISSNTSQQQPPFSPGYNDNSGGVWSQPPLPPFPPSSGSPHKFSAQPPLRPRYESPQKRSLHLLRAESPLQSLLLSSTDGALKRLPQPSAAFGNKQSDVPTQANLAFVKTLRFYHDRPTELPKEGDRVRKAMFARMLNHMDGLPKATLCPLQPGHDPTCPLSHTYIEVMTYNPLYKRLVCRQPSHYWGSQIQEDDSCVCLHVDTGLTWEWMDEARDKRMHCPRSANCINTKCFKSHSFEEMCWYNPSYKIKRCTVRAHDHITRARGMIVPPLDCSYYHIEEGKNADKREFTVESDHVGKDVKMLFIERTHKSLADLLEALRYARVNNL